MRITDKIKRKKHVKRSSLQTQQGVALYHALTPSCDIQNGQEYMAALDWALEQDDIQNIAISGPYGSGKSSVISTYFKRRNREDVLPISLAAFDLESMFVSEDKIKDDELEIGILKQLFYRVRADKIPKSRYRKLQAEKCKENICIGTIVECLFLILLYFVFPNKVNTFVSSVKLLSGGLTVVAIIAILAVIWPACYVAVRWFRKNGNIQEIKILDKATLKSGENGDKESVFNKNMDEIVYFFEETGYRIVVIEDLDRFESTNIFVALRELNNLLNHYEGIEEKITFIYAIKDDMFRKSGERTKFFDFIIPVVPYITSTNSGEILRQRLQFDDKKNASRLYDISGQYISLISPYISDMRDLTCICNEFIVFKNTLKGNQSLNLNDTQMFSLIVFKNLYPRDFAQLEDETNDSIVRQAFYDKRKFISEKEVLLNSKRKEKEEEIQKAKHEVLQNVRDLKIALFMCVMNYNSWIKSISVGNKTYTYGELLKDDFDVDSLKNQKLSVIYANANSYYNTSIADIEKTVADNGGDYFERLERVKNGLDTCIEDAKKEIEGFNQLLNELRTYSIQRMIDEFGTGFLSVEVRSNDLLVFLLRNGFIDENYPDYINYFHPNSISKDEMNFILGVRNHNSKMDFSYPLKNVSQIFDRLQDYEFQQRETLNYDLVDFVLTAKADSGAERFLIGQLSNHSAGSMSFIKAYFERTYNIERLTKLLCRNNHQFWADICKDTGISLESRFKYLIHILSYASIEDIKAQDRNEANEGVLSDFLLSHKDALVRLKEVPIEKQLIAIDSLGLVFVDVETEGIEESVKNHIFENCCYKLNMTMLSRLTEWKFPELSEGLKSRNYTTIRAMGYQPLIDYIHREFEGYASQIVLGVNSNVDEDINAVEDIIERLYPANIELAYSVLDKENVVWDSLEECCMVKADDTHGYKQKLWSYLLDNNKIRCTWHNVETYYNLFGDDKSWKSYIGKKIDDLIASAENTGISDDIRKKILFEDFAEDVFRKVATGLYKESYSDTLNKIDKMKIRVLIEEHLLPFTKTYWSELSTAAPDLRVLYATNNDKEFIQSLDDITLTIDEVNQILERDDFDVCYKDNILKKIKPSEMTEKTAMILRSVTRAIPKEYIEKAWELLADDKKYQLFLNHMDVYQNSELPLLFSQLSIEYQQFVERTRHRYSLAYTDYNKALLKKLKARNYITSVEESYAPQKGKALFSSKKEHILRGYVKQAK